MMSLQIRWPISVFDATRYRGVLAVPTNPVILREAKHLCSYGSV
jgi:hypothetical protein